MCRMQHDIIMRRDDDDDDDAKNHQKYIQNRSQTTTNQAKWDLKSVPEALLEGSGGHLGPKSQQDLKMPPQNRPKNRSKSLQVGGKLDQKLVKIGFKSHPKGDYFFDHSWDRLWERFGAILAPTWLPKPSQNGAKLVPKSIQVEMLI